VFSVRVIANKKLAAGFSMDSRKLCAFRVDISHRSTSGTGQEDFKRWIGQ